MQNRKKSHGEEGDLLDPVRVAQGVLQKKKKKKIKICISLSKQRIKDIARDTQGECVESG